MTEPITTQKSLIVPNTGDLAGAWGTSALNPNFQTIDAMFGGVTTITLSTATTILLSVPASTGIWPGTLSQSVNSLIVFTGAQTGSAVIQFTLPGFYIVHNKCTGTTFVQLAPSAGVGNKIGAPPGKKCHVFYDGTDMDYVDMPDPGTAYDLHINTTTLPPWMTACTVAPYLLKDGTTYSSAVYPALAQLLGSTFGGNGITTFAVPDERSRVRLGVDPNGSAGRITFGAAGFTGSLLGAAGGVQTSILAQSNLPNVNFSSTTNDVVKCVSGLTNVTLGGAAIGMVSGGASIGNVSMNSGGTGAAFPNVQPSLVSILALIKT